MALHSALGGDKHHAVCGTGTVDGGGSGVLQYGDLVDLGGVHCVDAAFHSVNEHERRCAGTAEGTYTPDAYHTAVIARSTGLGGYGHAGSNALQCGRGGNDRLVLQALGGNGRYGAGEVHFLLSVIADDHNLVEEVGVGFENDAVFHGLRNLYHRGIESEEGNLEFVSGPGLEYESTVIAVVVPVWLP